MIKIESYSAEVFMVTVVGVVLMALFASFETDLFWIFIALFPISIIITVFIRRILTRSGAVRWRTVFIFAALLWSAPLTSSMALHVLDFGWDSAPFLILHPIFTGVFLKDFPALLILSLVGWLTCCGVFFAVRVFPISRWIHWIAGVFFLAAGFCWFAIITMFFLQPFSGAAPPGAMSVEGHVRITMTEDGALLYTEVYKVFPRVKCETECWSIDEVKAFDSLALKEDESVRFEKIFVENFHDRPILGANIEVERLRRPNVESLGLLRAKFRVALDPIKLRVTTYRISQEVNNVKGRKLNEETDWQDLSLLGHGHSKVTMVVELPKNATIGTSPEGKTISLPDKDVTTLLIDDTHELEVYYLRRLRTAAVKALLGTASKSDLILKVLAWLFWPVAVISIGIFQQNLTQWLIAPLKKRFTKKPGRIGF